MLPAASPTAFRPVPAVLTDALGCTASKLSDNQEFEGAGIRLYRKRSHDAHLGHVETPATDRGVLVGVSMRNGHRRKILHEHHASSHDFGEHSIYVRNFADRYRADLSGAFDFVLLEIPRSSLEDAVADTASSRIDGLRCATGHLDPVLAHLVQALLPSLERPREACKLFVDQLGATIATHLVRQYSGVRLPSTAKSPLSKSHEDRAKAMLRSNIDGDISIGDVALACGLSRSHFTRAFKETTGLTPHQWLLDQRVAKARELLSRSRISLVEVAALCGFADQSHLTRLFTKVVGASPGKWRRESSF